MNSKKQQIIFGLSALIKDFEGEKKEMRQFLFTTPIGLIFGKLSDNKEPFVAPNSFNLGFALSSYNKELEKMEDSELKPILNEDCLTLKEVTVLTTSGDKFNFGSYILFYEQIIGVTLAPIDSQNTIN